MQREESTHESQSKAVSAVDDPGYTMSTMSKCSVLPAGAAAGGTLDAGFQIVSLLGVFSLQEQEERSQRVQCRKETAIRAEPRVWGAPGKHSEFGVTSSPRLPFLMTRDFPTECR